MELFAAFFSRREDVNDVNVLAAAAGRADLSVAEAVAVLDEARYAEAVRTEQQQWLDREVHAVPTFLFNGQVTVPGAQEAGTFVRVLERLVAS